MSQFSNNYLDHYYYLDNSNDWNQQDYYYQNKNPQRRVREYFEQEQKLVVQPFTNVGTFNWTAPQDTTVEYLIVGGGGGGGSAVDNSAGGGGGAGMVITGKMNVTKNKVYTIVVGKGGEPSNITRTVNGDNIFIRYASRFPAASGGNSSITTDQGVITALGGVGGDGGTANAESKWGKGGNATNGTNKGAQGGGNSNGTKNMGGGGGGGNKSNGETVQNNKGGKGGEGVISAISGKSVTYGAGGSGGVLKKVIIGKSGAPNSGNGGSGASSTSNKPEPKNEDEFVRVKGGSGGSGIVIFSYMVDVVKEEESTSFSTTSLTPAPFEESAPVEVVKPVIQEEVREITNYQLISGKDQYGATMGEPITNKTVEDVARICKSTPGCVGFVRDVGTNTYLLKSVWDNVFSNNNKELYLLKNTEMKEYNSQTNYDLLENTRRNGSTFLEESGKSVEECLMKCDTTNQCVGVVYTSDGRCNYKENIIGTQSEPNYKLYKKKNVALNDFKMFPGKDVYGGDMGQPIREKSLKEIADICIATPNCVGFIYDIGTQTAYLKNSFVNIYSTPQVTRTIFALPNAEVIDIKTGYDLTSNMTRVGYDINVDSSKSTNKSIDECLLQCNLIDQCAGIVYKPDTRTCNYKENILGGTAGENSELYKKRASTLNDFNFFPGKYKWGADMDTPITGKNIDEVAKMCKGKSKCVGFVRNPTDGTCYLKSDLNGMINFDPSLGEIYALNNIQPTNYDTTALYDMNANTNRTGYDISIDQGWSIERCLVKCDSMPNCSGVAYANNACYYKENIASSYPENNVNLYKKRSSALNQYSFVGGKDISQRDNPNKANPSNTVGFATNTNLATCSKNCNDNNNCVGFVWNANTKSCDLKSNLSPTASDVPGVEMYYKNNIIPQNYSFIPGVERSGADIGKSMKGSPNDCKNRCDTTANCKGFIYNPATSECWMKSDIISKRENHTGRDLYIRN